MKSEISGYAVVFDCFHQDDTDVQWEIDDDGNKKVAMVFPSAKSAEAVMESFLDRVRSDV